MTRDEKDKLLMLFTQRMYVIRDENEEIFESQCITELILTLQDKAFDPSDLAVNRQMLINFAAINMYGMDKEQTRLFAAKTVDKYLMNLE